MLIKSAEFITSATNFDDVRKRTENLPQVAFIGRSNVGKSSLINMLCNRKSLAVTSSTPGRTRLINFFLINSEFYFVDLPGYGFAAASKGTQGGWNDEIGGYLVNANSLKLVFVILDIRINPTANDITALNFLQTNGIPFAVLGSKADKLSRAEIGRAVTKLAQALGIGQSDIIITSSKDKFGRERVLEKVSQVIEI